MLGAGNPQIGFLFLPAFQPEHLDAKTNPTQFLEYFFVGIQLLLFGVYAIFGCVSFTAGVDANEGLIKFCRVIRVDFLFSANFFTCNF